MKLMYVNQPIHGIAAEFQILRTDSGRFVNRIVGPATLFQKLDHVYDSYEDALSVVREAEAILKDMYKLDPKCFEKAIELWGAK